MIARIWKGVTPASRADAYVDYLEATGIGDLRATEGNLGVYLLRRERQGRAEFLLLSLWETPEAIRRFAGPEMDKARYYPEDENFLLELEPTVDHYEVVRQVD
jgi:heme-degrading monooxygenase HmoA